VPGAASAISPLRLFYLIKETTMSNDINANAGAAPAATSNEPFLQRIEEFFCGAGEKTVDAVEVLAGHFEVETWPYVKHFLGTLMSQVGQAALKAAIAAAPLLASGGFGVAAAEVGASVVATVVHDAPLDAQETLQSVQAALQVVKVANSTVTAGDASTVVAIQAATTAQTAADEVKTGADNSAGANGSN
jgi:hypothetical protein